MHYESSDFFVSATPRTLSIEVIGLLGTGRTGESPWLWLIIPAGGLASYLLARSRSRKTGRPMEWDPRIYRIPGFDYLPWWLRAIVFAAIGGGFVYQLATGHDNWYWWLLATTAWLGFGSIVMRRKRLG